MKFILSLAISLVSFSAFAGTCDKVSGEFVGQCQVSHDRVKFHDDGQKEIHVLFQEESKNIRVVMNASTGPYHLFYVADGKTQIGRPMFEGDKYTARCRNNIISVRAEVSALKHPLVTEYSIDEDGKMFYMETLEGSNFIRTCTMDRI